MSRRGVKAFAVGVAIAALGSIVAEFVRAQWKKRTGA